MKQGAIMHKLQKSILYFLAGIIALILCLSIKNQVQADVSYTIPKIVIDAKVQKDGSMKMKTILTYHFDSNAQGLSYENHLPKNQKFKNIKVRVKRNQQKWETFYSKNRLMQILDQHLHMTKNSQKSKSSLPDVSHNYLYYDDGSFDVFDPDIKKGDTIQVEYNFVLTNAITNWKDTAELNRKFLGRKTDVEVDKARIALTFAQNPGKKLQLWVHSKAKGKIRITDHNQKILITADNIEPHTSLEIHAAFPKQVTSLNKNVKNKQRLKYIEKQETAITKQTQKQRIMHLAFYLVCLFIVAIPSVFSVRYAFFTKTIGYKPRKFADLPHSFEVPNLDPIMAQLLFLGKEPTQNGFAGFITQQVAKGRLSLKRLAHDNYEISVVDNEVVRDSSLLRDILVKGGDGKSVTTKQLRDADLGSAYSY